MNGPGSPWPTQQPLGILLEREHHDSQDDEARGNRGEAAEERASIQVAGRPSRAPTATGPANERAQPGQATNRGDDE